MDTELSRADEQPNSLSSFTATMPLTSTQKIPTVIWEDNQSTIHLAKDAKHHGRSKHIDVRYHFVRQYQEDNLVKVRYIPTGENIADMFTKPLSKSVFEKHKHSIGLLEKYMRWVGVLEWTTYVFWLVIT